MVTAYPYSMHQINAAVRDVGGPCFRLFHNLTGDPYNGDNGLLASIKAKRLIWRVSLFHIDAMIIAESAACSRRAANGDHWGAVSGPSPPSRLGLPLCPLSPPGKGGVRGS